MNFSNINLATSYKNRAFETTGTSLAIVQMENCFKLCTRKEAVKLEKSGYEIID